LLDRHKRDLAPAPVEEQELLSARGGRKTPLQSVQLLRFRGLVQSYRDESGAVWWALTPAGVALLVQRGFTDGVAYGAALAGD
jgi:hypothetical protein